MRGLTKDFKRSLLIEWIEDCIRYHMDLICIQETKCTKYEELMLNKHKLVILDQKTG